MSLNSKEISIWSNDDVIIWLKDLSLSIYQDNFQSNKMTGYDLCYLTNAELKDEFKINKYHDRSLIIKSIKEYLLDQFKLTVKYEEKAYQIQLDLEKKTLVEALYIMVREMFKINNEKSLFLLTSSGEVLSRHCNICDLLLLQSHKYRNLIAVTELKKINSINSDLTLNNNNTFDSMKKSPISGTEKNKQYYDLTSEVKYKKYNEITGINNNYNLPSNDKFDSNNLKDLKYNRSGDNFSNLQATLSKSSIENKNEKFESNDKYSQNSYNVNQTKEPKFIARNEDYNLDNSLEADSNLIKKYDNLGTDKYLGYKSKLERNNDKKFTELSDGLNEKDSFYDKELNSFSNNKNKNNNYNDELMTPKDSNFPNSLKFEPISQKHSPLRNTNSEKNRFIENKYDYLGDDKDALSLTANKNNRYFSSEKRVFRNIDNEKGDKFESNNSLGGFASKNVTGSSMNEEKDYFKGLNPSKSNMNTNKASYEENSYKSSIPSDLKYKLDSMRTDFNENIKKYQDTNLISKKPHETNIPMKQGSNNQSNLPSDKKIVRNNSITDKKPK